MERSEATVVRWEMYYHQLYSTTNTADSQLVSAVIVEIVGDVVVEGVAVVVVVVALVMQRGT